MTILARRLWRDESGALEANGYILFATIIVIGAIAGLATVRDSVVQEFGDIAVGMEKLDQSFTVTWFTPDGLFKEYGFVDDQDGGDDLEGEAPGCIEICAEPTGGEGD